MRKIVIAIMGTLSALVLVVSFDASRRDPDAVTSADDGGTPAEESAPIDPTDPTGRDEGGERGEGDSDASPTVSSAPAPTTSSRKSGVSGTFTGRTVQTHHGPVQVRIVVKSNKIVRAQAIQYPKNNHHDEKINSWAIPQLEQATLDSNGRQIDSYSGATVTCDGYRQSLQSALDKAHL